MAEIDPDVETLLATLLQGPLASLGRLAVERLVADGETDEDDGEGAGRFGVSRDGEDTVARILKSPEDPRHRRRRQLTLATKVVMAKLDRERAISERLRDLAPRLALKRVAVMPGPANANGETADLPSDDLLDPQRDAAIAAFQDVWVEAVNDLRAAWEVDDGE